MFFNANFVGIIKRIEGCEYVEVLPSFSTFPVDRFDRIILNLSLDLIKCGLSWLSLCANAPHGCGASSVTFGAFVTNGFFEWWRSSFDKLVHVKIKIPLLLFLSFCQSFWNICIVGVDPSFLLMPRCWTAKTGWSLPPKSVGVNICQANQTLKLITDNWLRLSLLKICYINNVHTDKDKAMPPKEKRPPPLVLMYPAVKSVHIPKLIAEVDRYHIFGCTSFSYSYAKSERRVPYMIWVNMIILWFFWTHLNGAAKTLRGKWTGLVSWNLFFASRAQLQKRRSHHRTSQWYAWRDHPPHQTSLIP